MKEAHQRTEAHERQEAQQRHSAEAFRRAHALLVDRAKEGPHFEDPTKPETVQAMQIVLKLPKTDPPARHNILAAAAQAVVRVCLDERVATDYAIHEAFHAWYGHLIRKVARRARNAGWEHIQHLPGITATVEDAQARAFVPSAVSAVPAEIKKLQISGTDVPWEEELPEPTEPVVIYCDAGLVMSVGKAAAQVGHASMMLAAQRPVEFVEAWAKAGFPLAVREVPSEVFQAHCEAPDAVAIRDAGFTEVEPGSITVVARGLTSPNIKASGTEAAGSTSAPSTSTTNTPDLSTGPAASPQG